MSWSSHVGLCVAMKDGFSREHYDEMRDLGATHIATVPWLVEGHADADIAVKCDSIRRFADAFIR